MTWSGSTKWLDPEVLLFICISTMAACDINVTFKIVLKGGSTVLQHWSYYFIFDLQYTYIVGTF